jgi:hypothetical protein
MPWLPASGLIRMQDISAEYEPKEYLQPASAPPWKLRDYLGASWGLPSSGTIRMSDFYSQHAPPVFRGPPASYGLATNVATFTDLTFSAYTEVGDQLLAFVSNYEPHEISVLSTGWSIMDSSGATTPRLTICRKIATVAGWSGHGFLGFGTANVPTSAGIMNVTMSPVHGFLVSGGTTSGTSGTANPPVLTTAVPNKHGIKFAWGSSHFTHHTGSIACAGYTEIATGVKCTNGGSIGLCAAYTGPVTSFDPPAMTGFPNEQWFSKTIFVF